MLLCLILIWLGPTVPPKTDRTQRGKCIWLTTPVRPTFELAVKYILYKSYCSMRELSVLTGSNVARSHANANCSFSCRTKTKILIRLFILICGIKLYLNGLLLCVLNSNWTLCSNGHMCGLFCLNLSDHRWTGGCSGRCSCWHCVYNSRCCRCLSNYRSDCWRKRWRNGHILNTRYCWHRTAQWVRQNLN